MKTWRTRNNITIKTLLKGGTNVYLVTKGDMNIIVDSARAHRYKKLKHVISDSLSGKNPDFLFLTHSHYDHVENACRLKEDFSLKIIIDEREAKFLSEGKTPLPEGTNGVARMIVWLGNNLTKIDRYRGVKCDVCFDDIYEIKTRDDDIRMLRTPGHSPGSASLILDQEIALVGDTLFGIFRRSVFPPFASDVREMIQSWKKLLDTGCEIFLPGHGRAISRERLEREYGRRAEEE